MVDIHRHDEFSTFDGFGKASELAELAKELGHSSFSTTNHGSLNGLVKHYKACQKSEINCIMGVEAYFQPEFDKEKPRYHLCLFAKNLKGYENLNKIMYYGELQKYYTPNVTFKDLEECKEGLICSSACIGGFVSRAIMNGKIKMARKALMKFKEIFGEDFYIEIQPYKIDKLGTQEKVNAELVRLAEELDVKCILTSDSHYGRKEDFDTYIKMHEIAKHKYDIEETYSERYMPTGKDLYDRFLTMHTPSLNGKAEWSLKATATLAKEMISNIEVFETKFEQGILDELTEELPKLDGCENSYGLILQKVKEGLKERGKHKNKEYIDRCKQELNIIKMHGFADYFLIVSDYVSWAKEKGIAVGPGRGSVCNCEIAYVMGITEVDSIKFGLDFRRFLREDKKKLPDIDLDFETSRRQEVIDYLTEKYKGHAAQVGSYGLYKVDNLMNDLAKVCGVEDKEELKRLKSFVNTQCCDDAGEINEIHYDEIKKSFDCVYFDKTYDNIMKHFCKLYKKLRFIGTHAAGVAITGEDIKKYCGIRVTDEGREYSVYDLADLDDIHVVKFDMLGLKTMESLGELRALTGNNGLTDEIYEDRKIWQEFENGNTDGIFQFEKGTPQKILKDIKADCFEDIVAASSMNRPGPLSMKMPAQYAHNKFDLSEAQNTEFYEYTKETYGTIVYQEQIQKICVELAGMSWSDSDRVMKLMKNAIASMGEMEKINQDKRDLTEEFAQGMEKYQGMNYDKAKEMFEKVLVYTFNKGHGVGYGMISLEEMFYKIYHATEFWYVKMKYCGDDVAKLTKFKERAVAGGVVVFLPHVNYSSNYCIRKVDGEMIIQEGLSSLKNVGEKAADEIENERKKNGPFTSYDNFYDRCKSRVVNKRAIDVLMESGALEFNKKTFISRVIKYNSALYMRGLK